MRYSLSPSCGKRGCVRVHLAPISTWFNMLQNRQNYVETLQFIIGKEIEVKVALLITAMKLLQLKRTEKL